MRLRFCPPTSGFFITGLGKAISRLPKSVNRSCAVLSGVSCSSGSSAIYPRFRLGVPRRRCGKASLVRSTFQHVFTDERPISQALSDDGRRGVRVSLGVRHFPVVEPEALLVKIAEQVKRLDRHVSAVNRTLQQRPEILAAVGVNLAVDGLVAWSTILCSYPSIDLYECRSSV